MDISLDEAKSYMRIDYDDEDSYILSLIHMATTLVYDMITKDSNDLTPENLEIIRIAVLYATAYMYDHRDNPNYSSMLKTLRAILFPIRKVQF